MTRFVLAIDGGGIGGVVASRVLYALEQRVGALHKAFDLIHGTSTGGIIALMLAHQKRYSARRVGQLYTQFGAAIFKRSLLSRVLDQFGLFAPQYGEGNIEAVLQHFLEDYVMASATTEVAVTVFNMSTGRAEILTNRNSGLKMWQAARATSAAPTYFPPFGPYIDGGIAANNPAALAASYARELWPKDGIFVVSVGCGRAVTTAEPIDAKTWGALDWLKRITQFFMQGSMSSAAEEAAAALGDHYIRIQEPLDGPSGRMDDASPKNIEALVKFGDEVVRKNQFALARIAKEMGKEK